MATYRKKPIEVEAWKWVNKEAPIWIYEAIQNGRIRVTSADTGKDKYKMIIKTLEGDHTASEGDYIIKGVKGELYPCKPDIFEMTYESI